MDKIILETLLESQKDNITFLSWINDDLENLQKEDKKETLILGIKEQSTKIKVVINSFAYIKKMIEKQLSETNTK